MGAIRDSEGNELATKPADVAVAKHCGSYPYIADKVDERIDDRIHTIYYTGPNGRCRLQVEDTGVVVLDESGPIYIRRWVDVDAASIDAAISEMDTR